LVGVGIEPVLRPEVARGLLADLDTVLDLSDPPLEVGQEAEAAADEPLSLSAFPSISGSSATG
jgi:hypothetical protein